MRLIGLMLVLSFGSLSYATINPVQITRVQTKVAPTYGKSTLLETKIYGRVYVSLMDRQNDKTLVDLIALDEKGRSLGSVALNKPQDEHSFISLVRVDLNLRNEIVVIHTDYKNGSPNGNLYSANLTTGKATQLISVGRFMAFMDRIAVGGKSLVAVSGDLNEGPHNNNLSPTLYRVVNEDTGELIQEKTLDYAASGKLGLNRQGQLQLLLFGYEIFELMDVKSGNIQMLTQVHPASYYPTEVDLCIGHFLTLQDEQGLKLLKIQDLINGVLKPIQTLPSDSRFVGRSPEKYVVNDVDGGMQISDLRTGKPLGPVIPQVLGRNDQRLGYLDMVMEAHGQLFAVTSEPVQPNSYMPGTRLKYYNVTTGTLLRVNEIPVSQMTGELFLSQSGEVMTLESVDRAYRGEGFKVINLKTNALVSEMKTGNQIGASVKTRSGIEVALIGNEEEKSLCLVSVLDPKDRSCFKDPLLKQAVVYGYEPFAIADGQLILPLLGDVANLSYDVLGYTVIRLN